MKLRRLDLLRYGHLSDVGLTFSGDAPLYVVHGANEAGKSTALAAIADALFGFGHRTDFDFLHGGPQLRVGFTLQAVDGSTEAFVRRKGRRDTLRDATDQLVPEDVLRRFLGGASRELFERSFGLDGARLREGGQELLRSGGEAGESLLAGAGLLNLRTALAKLDEEAKSLFGDGRGKRRLSEAVDAWRHAQRASEERSVLPRAWTETEAARVAAAQALRNVQEDGRALAAENSRLQRVRRVAPLLAELNGVRANLAALADVPHLPPEAESRRQSAFGAKREATRDAEREAAERANLSAMHAALPQDAAVLAAQDAIDALAEQRSVVSQASNDLPGVTAKVTAYRARVEEALKDLGSPVAPDAARDAVPVTARRSTVQRLIKQRVQLETAAASAVQSLAAAGRRRDQAEATLRSTPLPASAAQLRRTIEATRGEGPLDLEFERAGRVLADAKAAAITALATLPLWRGDMAALVACRLPLLAESDAASARLETAAQIVTQRRTAVAELASEIAVAEEDVARLGRGEMVPTPDVVAAARAERDRAWQLVRRVYEGGAQVADEERSGLPSGPLCDVFEVLRDAADRLSDRRADDAQRVADFLSATTRLELLRQRRDATVAALATAETDFAEAGAAWHGLWAPTNMAPEAPAAMAEWRRARADVLQRAEAEAEARRRCEELAGRRDRARAALAALLSGATGQEMLTALLQRAETECEALETEIAEYRKRADALTQEDSRLPELQDTAKDAEAALVKWQSEWSVAIAALGLPADASIDVAETALDAWSRIAEMAPAWRSDAQRIADMASNIEGFAEQVRAVQATLGEPITDEPPQLVASRLVRRLGEARNAAADASALTERMMAHEAAAADAARRLRAAEEELTALRNLAGAADDTELERAIERARRRDAATADFERLQQALLGQGDGRSEEVLRTEVAEVDLDAVIARLSEIETETAVLGARREALSAERTQAEAKLREMRDGHDATAKAQEAEDALAEASAAAERYARLHVARVLLRSGIDRFRSEQQGPLLRAAGTHFALLTSGRYRRLVVDQDTAGRAVLHAMRDTGTECSVEALSEGTRDQLYLALRVAAIERHAANAEALPFIADDLLVNFDDARSAAAIALLAELGKTTQVILFTHHDHIASLASAQAGAVVLRLHDLPAVSRSLPVDLVVG